MKTSSSRKSRAASYASALAAGTVLAALTTLSAPAAHAADIDFGTITAPVSLPLIHDASLGAFTDTYSFSIGAGASFDFSALADTGFGRRSGILDLAGSLFDAGGALLEAGDAQTRYLPEGYPTRSVSFASLLLGAGAYRLVFTGTAASFVPELPIGAGYTGNLDFTAAAAPVPEPEIVALYGLGLIAIGALVRARQRKRGG